jgi:hypothetical protein
MQMLAVLPLLIALTAGWAGEDPDSIAGEAAPAHIADLLVEEATAERLTPFFTGKPSVIAASAHGVAAIETSAGRAILWAATPRSGPICFVVEFGANGGTRADPKCGPRLSTGVPMVTNLIRPVVAARELVLVVGWTHESVTSVVMRTPGGEESDLPLSERFFIAEVPAEHVPKKDLRKGETHDVIARDGTGADLERWPVAGVPRPLFFNPRVTGPKRTVIDTTDSRGRRLRLSLIPIEGNEMCVERKTGNGTSGGCGPKLSVDQGIQVHPTLMGSMVFVSGSVGPEVAKLELHHQDGFVLELPIVERFVLHDIPRERFEDGKRPNLLVGMNRAGVEVAREKVGQRVFRSDSAIWSGRDVGP